MKYLSTALNFVFGAILYYGPVLEGFRMWVAMFAGSVFALMSIFVFGMFAYGWHAMLTDPNSYDYFTPGQPRAVKVYRSTANILRYYDSRFAFWMSVASSVFLMLGMVSQGWKVVLFLEIISSALSYNFIHWASQRLPEMHLRAHGTEMKP